jgi:hypothetical protein
VGTAVFAIVNFSTRTLAGLSELVVGGVLLVVILVAPTGLMGLVDKLRRRGGAEAPPGAAPRPHAPPGAKNAAGTAPASGAAAPAPGVVAAPLDSKEGQ